MGIPAYFDALSRGHTKAAAAGLAGVSEVVRV